MKKIILLLFLPLLAASQNSDSLMLRKLYDYYLTQSKAYSNLDYLCNKIGGRLSGSPQAEQAVQWAKNAMYEAGADTVILEPCMVAHWVRGKKEKCTLTWGSTSTELKCLALGNSVGTGDKGIKSLVVEVSNFEELAELGEKQVKGKIVFYNVFFDQSYVHTSHAYRDAVKYRSLGASMAAKYGAVATLIRSMTSAADDEPHTGNMNFDTTLSKKKIPALALSYKAADALHEALKKNPNAALHIETHCQTLPNVLSYNVIGQINGSSRPNEFILAGGHLDSWDPAQGAHDDGAGVVQCIEMLTAYKYLGIRPKHSIRAVAFMNEENGLAGGTAYANIAKEKNEKHLAALETDAGGFTPRALDVDTLHGLYKLVSSWKDLFHPYMIDRINQGGGGSDTGPLEKTGVPGMSYEPDGQRYFDIHHSPADTFDKVNKRELDLGGAAIAALLYLVDKYY